MKHQRDRNYVAKHMYELNKPKTELTKKEKELKKKFDNRSHLYDSL